MASGRTLSCTLGYILAKAHCKLNRKASSSNCLSWRRTHNDSPKRQECLRDSDDDDDDDDGDGDDDDDDDDDEDDNDEDDGGGGGGGGDNGDNDSDDISRTCNRRDPIDPPLCLTRTSSHFQIMVAPKIAGVPQNRECLNLKQNRRTRWTFTISIETMIYDNL
ncbi:hypothetical protein HZH68_012849 [Vespula germanica]|uniref:Uncharacterized protein n=1 Tax=Vespula germanica TaxID=30212 RepID=A0A834JG18_VESGE|nr:hypothetical protein HZH68_012849 [Vespula germanica]